MLLQGEPLTDYRAVDHVEMVAVQHRLAAQLLEFLVAAVMCQTAPGGQMGGK